MFTKSIIPSLIFLIFCWSGASAALQDQGDYVLDTDTGFKWVKPTLTLGINIWEGGLRMRAHREFADCRYPQVEEVQDLLTKLGLPTSSAVTTPEGEAAVEAAINLIGDTLDAQMDADNHPNDVAPGAAGWTRAGYAPERFDEFFLYINDRELVDRVTGDPVVDGADGSYAVARNSYDWDGKSNVGLIMICKDWPTQPVTTSVIDFEDVADGATAPILSNGFVVTGDANAKFFSGEPDTVIESSSCTDCDDPIDYSTSLTISRADNKPFAFYDIDVITLGTLQRLGNCKQNADGISATEEDCGIYGTTTWGEKIHYAWGYPDLSSGEPYVGDGMWRNLQSLTVQLRKLPTEGTYGPCLAPCKFRIDDVLVADAEEVIIDLDPWNSDNVIDPTNTASNYFITVAIETTSIADGEAKDFSGADVDTDSLRLGPLGATVKANVLQVDKDGDGDLDYVYGFRMIDTGISCVDNRVVLSGETNAGVPFAAADAATMPADCFETINIDLEPGDPSNRVYPDDDYAVQVGLYNMSDSNGDPFDFFSSGANNIRLGSKRARVTAYLALGNQYPASADHLAFFQMEDTGITCDDTDVEIVGEYRGTYPSYSGFPSGKPAFKVVAPVDPRDCDTGCHP